MEISVICDGKKCSIEISSEPVGQFTNSTKNDFYVYEWFIKETGEVFYVGKGRGNRYKEYHERAYEAELKITTKTMVSRTWSLKLT